MPNKLDLVADKGRTTSIWVLMFSQQCARGFHSVTHRNGNLRNVCLSADLWNLHWAKCCSRHTDVN